MLGGEETVSANPSTSACAESPCILKVPCMLMLTLLSCAFCSVLCISCPLNMNFYAPS